MLGTTTKLQNHAVSSSRVKVTLERNIHILGLTVTESKQERNKKVKTLKDVGGWHAKKYANKVGMMHESKGQHIGKALFLHLVQLSGI